MRPVGESRTARDGDWLTPRDLRHQAGPGREDAGEKSWAVGRLVWLFLKVSRASDTLERYDKGQRNHRSDRRQPRHGGRGQRAVEAGGREDERPGGEAPGRGTGAGDAKSRSHRRVILQSWHRYLAHADCDFVHTHHPAQFFN